MPQNVRRHLGAEPGRAHGRREALAHALDRLAVPLDHRLLGEPEPLPAAQVGKQPRRQLHRRLTLLGLPAPDRAAIEHALLKVDMAAADRRHRTRRRRSRDDRVPV